MRFSLRSSSPIRTGMGTVLGTLETTNDERRTTNEERRMTNKERRMTNDEVQNCACTDTPHPFAARSLPAVAWPSTNTPLETATLPPTEAVGRASSLVLAPTPPRI